MEEAKYITTSTGMPISDNNNSLTVGQRGPILLQDFHLIDKLAHFDRQRIPQRVVHAKGAGAYGYFQVTHDLTKYCRAAFLSKVGKKTPVFLRFSTVAGERGAADTQRDPRGFAVKFYTQEGNYDLVGNNTPVFFIRDPIQFPDFIHSQKRNPRTNCKDADAIWDFFSLVPQTVHQMTILFSNRGTPDGYRFMNGYGSHTFKWVNKDNEFYYIKMHFKSGQGIKNLTSKRAQELEAEDPDYATRDLYDAIEKGEFPKWNVKVQIMPPDKAATYRWNPFDVTKIWPHSDFPLMDLGKMVLDKNPANYFAEVEQSAFSPSHTVPGIEPSEDRMLQGRLFSYPDTHRHRLGANYDQIPVNCPYKARLANMIRDGPMCINGNQGGAINYEPNSFGGPKGCPAAKWKPVEIKGLVDRFIIKSNDDDYVQAGELYEKVFDEEEKQNTVNNIVDAMTGVKPEIQKRQIAIFKKANLDYGTRIAKGLKLE